VILLSLQTPLFHLATATAGNKFVGI
jgi:hypothetical protein